MRLLLCITPNCQGCSGDTSTSEAIPEKLRMIPNQGSKTCWRNCNQTRVIHRLMISF